jgi:glycolate oxidase iron-sulfur subunit
MQFLGEIPLRDSFAELSQRVAYHEACHLCHAQKVREEPVDVLRSIGVDLAPLKESDMCCGSAGVYNLTHNDRSMLILDRKMDHIEATDADIVLTGNPGCLLQLDYGRRAAASDKPVLHPVQVVDAAYRAERARTGQPARFSGIPSGDDLRTRAGKMLAIAANGRTKVPFGRKSPKKQPPSGGAGVLS